MSKLVCLCRVDQVLVITGVDNFENGLKGPRQDSSLRGKSINLQKQKTFDMEIRYQEIAIMVRSGSVCGSFRWCFSVGVWVGVSLCYAMNKFTSSCAVYTTNSYIA